MKSVLVDSQDRADCRIAHFRDHARLRIRPSGAAGVASAGEFSASFRHPRNPEGPTSPSFTGKRVFPAVKLR